MLSHRLSEVRTWVVGASHTTEKALYTLPDDGKGTLPLAGPTPMSQKGGYPGLRMGHQE